MPTHAAQYTHIRQEPAAPRPPAAETVVPMTAGTYAKGTVLGLVTATGKYAAYNNANSDGTEVARCILQYACIVDANGNVALGAVSSGDEQGAKLPAAPVWIAGPFRTAELTGLDAAGVADLGRLVLGTVADGLIHVN